jgi:membrane-associated phospholipid phosphatase
MRSDSIDRDSGFAAQWRMTASVKGLLAGISILALFGLGILAKTALVTRHDLRFDVQAEHMRFPLATASALAVTSAASEAVGIGVLLIAAIALILRRRRWDAARLIAAVGASWVLGIAMKLAIDRARPPAILWLLKPDSSESFPSGHDTTACVMIVIALVAFRRLPRTRAVATVLAIVFAVLVGMSRIYLGDHFPTDVLGSWLTVASASLAVWSIMDLRPLRRLGVRLLRDPSPVVA